ncbi:MAG TPA: ATP synthase F0 subunit C [Myxococcota bacterium]|jgi:F-type H+-transporting ATPase subunit c
MRKFGKVVLWTVAMLLFPLAAMAQEASGGGSDGTWGYALGAGLAIGLAGLGCGIGQGLTAGNTTAGIARNPGAAGSMFTNFILGMVLIESIAIYGLVIAFQLQGKIPNLP